MLSPRLWWVLISTPSEARDAEHLLRAKSHVSMLTISAKTSDRLQGIVWSWIFVPIKLSQTASLTMTSSVSHALHNSYNFYTLYLKPTHKWQFFLFIKQLLRVYLRLTSRYCHKAWAYFSFKFYSTWKSEIGPRMFCLKSVGSKSVCSKIGCDNNNETTVEKSYGNLSIDSTYNLLLIKTFWFLFLLKIFLP